MNAYSTGQEVGSFTTLTTLSALQVDPTDDFLEEEICLAFIEQVDTTPACSRDRSPYYPCELAEDQISNDNGHHVSRDRSEVSSPDLKTLGDGKEGENEKRQREVDAEQGAVRAAAVRAQMAAVTTTTTITIRITTTVRNHDLPSGAGHLHPITIPPRGAAVNVTFNGLVIAVREARRP